MSHVKKILAALLIGLAGLALAPLPSQAAEDIGALAYSRRTGALGWSYNYDDEESARERAMQECRKYANDCKIARTFQNVCVSVARDGNHMGWAWGYAGPERRRRAIDECRSDGGRNCTIAAQFCTGDADN